MRFLSKNIFSFSENLVFPLSLTKLFGFTSETLNKSTELINNVYFMNGVPEFLNISISNVLNTSNEYYVASNKKGYIVELSSNEFLTFDSSSSIIRTSFSEIDMHTCSVYIELLFVLKMALNDSFANLVEKLMEFKDITNNLEIEKNRILYAKIVESLFSFIEYLEDNCVFESTFSGKRFYKHEVNMEYPFLDNLTAKFGFALGSVISPVSKDMFQHFVVQDLIENKVIKTEAEWEKKNWNIHTSRIFSEKEEEMMLETTMRLQDYKPFSESKTAVEAFYYSTTLSEPVFAAMFYGPSGTGKTELVQYLGEKLHLPVVTFQCTANTEEIDLVGKAKSLGIAANSSGNIEYTTTPLIEAVENGWMIEIQEVASIKEPAVIQLFNSLLDGTRKLSLSDGRQISVHPDFKIFFTTNVVYEGCQNLNQSFISRCQFVMYLAAPSQKEMVDRLIQKTGYDGPVNDIKDVVECINNVSKFLEDAAIDDGACDFRSCYDWVRQRMATGWSWSKCADFTVIPKATLFTEYHPAIKGIVDAKFENA